MKLREQCRSIFGRQWSFALGGFIVGLGEVIYFLKFGTFIPVTEGLARMFATVEQNLVGTTNISRVYSPDIHWVIIGALLGAWLVGRLENESRNWVKYSPGMLFISLVGGIIFGFGTRLGPGCTTHHIFGGLSVMSLASWTIAILGLPFAFAAFEIVSWLGYGPYFKHQETLETTIQAKQQGLHNHHCLTYDEHYSPWTSPLRLIPWTLVAIVILTSLYTGFFGDTAQALGSGPIWPNIVRLLAGIGLGVGIAKAGVGTECGLMSPESLLVPEAHYRKLNIPQVTRRMFQALLPVSGILAAIITLNVAVLIMWLGFGWSLPDAAPKPANWGLHIGHLLAAPCLAIGSVFMIGCEIRSYARVGLGYLTGIVGFVGFYLGYLPYIYFQGPIDTFIARHTLVRATNIPELITSNPDMQKIIGVLYTLTIILLFVIVIVSGAKRIGVTVKDYMVKNTDDLCLSDFRRDNDSRS
jgi:hypothetical protein